MLAQPNITAEQIVTTLAAIPAFVPATVCTGYLAAWYTDLHGFRRRSLVERIFWSIPLSFAISPVVFVLIGRYLSLTAITGFLVLTVIAWSITLGAETLVLRRSNKIWVVGFKPLGIVALAMIVFWIALALFTLVDFQRDSNLYSSLFLLDQSARINWTQSVLRTGIPPANPYYFYQHPAPMQNYYFWYVLCAAVAKLFHLSVRAVFNASCIWAGFALASIIGLYLKHVLCAGARLRRQFLVAISLLGVTGLNICVNIVGVIFFHRHIPLDLEWWSKEDIVSWYGSLFWVPHHLTALTCCMFALLLAWLSKPATGHSRIAEIIFIGVALASAFGMSIFVPFGFFLVAILWAVWQIAFERKPRPVLQLAAGGALALILLIPFITDLRHTSSSSSPSAGKGTPIFAFSIREMIPADALLQTPSLRSFALTHPHAARSFVSLLLVPPAYAVELGFYALVLLIFVIPALRPTRLLSSGERLLVFLAIAVLPFITFIRSTVLNSNDFGWRAALLLQFPLLLLGSDLLMRWKADPHNPERPPVTFHHNALRAVARLTLIIGVLGTISQSLLLRFDDALLNRQSGDSHDPQAGIISHNAYISYLGYQMLNRLAPRDAIVQFNPDNSPSLWERFDFVNVNHQIAIGSNKLWCGSNLGGDPSGCPAMIAAIDPLFQGAPAAQARAACRQYGIHYLIAKIYDPAWNDPSSWVWTLNPVVADPEFRALDCSQQSGVQ